MLPECCSTTEPLEDVALADEVLVPDERADVPSDEPEFSADIDEEPSLSEIPDEDIPEAMISEAILTALFEPLEVTPLSLESDDEPEREPYPLEVVALVDDVDVVPDLLSSTDAEPDALIAFSWETLVVPDAAFVPDDVAACTTDVSVSPCPSC